MFAAFSGKLNAVIYGKLLAVYRFESISDFFTVNDALRNTKLVVCEDIEHGLEKLTDPDDLERRQRIRQLMQTVDLEVEYGRIQETNAVKEKISQLLQDTEFKPMTDNIIKFFSDNKLETSKKLYTGTLHEFGLKNGVAIYRLLKDVV